MPGHDSHRRPTIAVVIPCFNEEKTVGRVVEDFLRVLPDCIVVIADNNSTDDTARAARAAGAIVITERRRGKGMAVRKLLADVDAECFVMVDGDATYDAASAIEMTRLVLEESYDMVIGVRKTPEDGGEEYRSGHRFGNAILTWIFKSLFGLPISDTLSGYRAMSRRFAKTFPGSPEGFEVEAELNVHAAVMEAPVAEVPTTYIARPIGSSSKLRTYRDGWRIL
ncbi:MAG TPA: glycosyl transferase, partial [Actinobacteria bacterium]|nr:glycosyl transferase [Actinomycetota bacterium]